MKTISVLIACLLLVTSAAPRTSAAPKGGQARPRAEKVKAGVAKLGVGESARVEVKLLDGSKLRGHIGEAGSDGFVVVDRKTGAATPVKYEEVRQLGGVGMSTGTKVAIGLGVAAVTLLTLALIGLHYAD